MDRRKHLDACLQAHRDLLELQREVHQWIDGLAGWDVAGWDGADRRRAERPPRPAHATAPGRRWRDAPGKGPWQDSARPWESEREGAWTPPARGRRWERPPGH